MITGDELKKRRLELGLTLEDVGKAVGVGKSTVRKWEEGIIKEMRRGRLQAYAEVLQISPVLLINRGENSNSEFSNDELEFIRLYRNAETSAREIAIETLRNHQKKISSMLSKEA